MLKDEEIAQLINVAQQGIHDPSVMPFGFPWTDKKSPAFERDFLQFHWKERSEWKPDSWSLNFGVFLNGKPIGAQALSADKFSQTKTCQTGSWLGKKYQGKGYGKEMRSAVLELAFGSLGATEVYSGAYENNKASLGVSKALGYEENGKHIQLSRTKPLHIIDLRLTRATWLKSRRKDIRVAGLEPCLPLFGLKSKKK